jgi:light-regulated signal transduction histidine kinase (bacteriophytochrome)
MKKIIVIDDHTDLRSSFRGIPDFEPSVTLGAESSLIGQNRIEQTFNDMADSMEERTAALEEAKKQLAEEIKRREAVEAQLTRYIQSNEDLVQFAHVASHDLREPLRKISSFSTQLQKNNLPEEQQQDYLKRVQSAAERMTLMIDNLLMYTKVGEQHNTQIEVDLTSVAQQVVEDIDMLIKEKAGRVEVASLPTIRADRFQMYRLFQNLIVNGLKYHRQGVPPVVRVTTQEDEQNIHIRVQDNSVGIAEKDSERIFKIFERLHGRNDGGGSGLGLAICRKIVLYHGGTITVESTVGVGSVFILSFPHSIKMTTENSDTIQV